MDARRLQRLCELRRRFSGLPPQLTLDLARKLVCQTARDLLDAPSAKLCAWSIAYAMLRCAALCCAVLCYAVLCCAMLCYAMLCYAMLCYAMLCYMLCYAVRLQRYRAPCGTVKGACASSRAPPHMDVVTGT